MKPKTYVTIVEILEHDPGYFSRLRSELEWWNSLTPEERASEEESQRRVREADPPRWDGLIA